MKTVGAFEAKTHLSALLEEVERGAVVLITRRGRPVARLSPAGGGSARRLGLWRDLRPPGPAGDWPAGDAAVAADFEVSLAKPL